MKTFEKYFSWLLAAGILLNANGLLNDILEPDGGLYATIAKHIAVTGDWMNLFGDGHDWLDKPHLPFWLTAASFKIFGINAFAYKLPAFIFWLTGIWFTYKLAKELYNKHTAKVAAVIYVFALHGILNNFDIRAEPYLTALIVAAIYYVYKAGVSGKWSPIILAALVSACAIMTKGIFVLITIGGGFVIYWIITKQWKQFINYRWWLMVVLILLFITPELYSLYMQFDLHPEKVVFGRTHVSGIRFFFWDSQFGRFFNTGPIKGHGDPGFFLHTTLWAFLPWSILLYTAVVNLFKESSNPTQASAMRWIIYGSAAITFLLFSFSRFQLPYYIVILFPHFSIITANYLTTRKNEITFTRFITLQHVLFILAAILVCVLAWFSGFGSLAVTVIIALTFVMAKFVLFKVKGIKGVLATGAAFSLVLFVFLFNIFYPKLMHYQSGMMAAKYLRNDKIYTSAAIYQYWSYSFEFYAPGLVKRLNTADDADKYIKTYPSGVIFASEQGLLDLQQQGFECTVLQTFPYFHISMLTGAFLNPATRNRETLNTVLLKVRKRNFR